MKRLLILFIAICGLMTATYAATNCDTDQQRLTPQEFRDRQQEFIANHAGLTTEESEKFFPLYFELQSKKKDLNDKVWKLFKEGKNSTTTEERYNSIVDEVCDIKISIDKLDKSYTQKFKAILSGKKIYLIQEAEMKFRKDMLRGFGPRPGGQDKKKNQQGSK